MNKFAGKLDLLTAAQEEHAGTNTERGPPDGTKNTATNGGVKYSFTPYSEKQKKNWGNSRSIVICETEKQIRKFVSDARKGTNIGKKMYLGAIPASLAKTIRIETGLNVEGYNCSVAAQEIRKIFKDHGNEQTENLRGQRAITEYDFVNIPVVIQSPDKITRSERL